jgi:hypothetical protein
MTNTTHADLRSLLGCRVRVVTADSTPAAHDYVLRFLPSKRAVFAQPGTGLEVAVDLVDIVCVEDARIECKRCHSRVNNTWNPYLQHWLPEDVPPGTADTLCASCYRSFSYQMPAPIMECPECGKQPAFYSPRDKVFACAQCHGMRHSLTGLGVEERVMRTASADCKGADTDDPRHRWQNVKGHRYNCQKCFAKRFTDPDIRTLARP